MATTRQVIFRAALFKLTRYIMGSIFCARATSGQRATAERGYECRSIPSAARHGL